MSTLEKFCLVDGRPVANTIVIMCMHIMFYAIDVSGLKLSLLETNKFSIAWTRAYDPTGYNVDAYNITVTNQDGQILQSGSVMDATSERFHYTYISERSRSEFPECSKLVFSVVAVANGTSSQGANVSWSAAEKGEFV